ncbi:hypothetical protein [Rugamonas sp.]|uniref:hypothetical protein n=1 Tax=Rugamonas sp. TaxID=1926287 RepID=UPI0025DBD973|nr:hypothetical protein [Rugamonas sp.]
MIGFPNRIDTAAITGGSFVATLPLANLQTRSLGEVARSTNLNLSSTRFDIAFPKQVSARVFALPNHNITIYGKYRLRCSNDPGYATTLFDTGWVRVWPAIYPYGTLPWEDSRWWSGRNSLDQLAGQYATLTVILPQTVVAQYWRLEIDDGGNPAGFIQAGRVFIGPAWQPATNPSFGLSIGWETKTDVQAALGGAEYFGRRVPYRVTKFTIDYMSEDEGFASAFDMDRQAGIDQEVFWVHDPDDTVHAQRRQYLGRFQVLNPLQLPVFNTTTKAYEIKELQ